MNISSFTNETKNFSGRTVKVSKPESKMTNKRKVALATLVSIASNLNESQFAVAIKILQGSRNDMAKYVRSNGLVPFTDINRLIVQCALLRLSEISKVSKTLDVDSEQALKEIDEAETEAIISNQSDNILTPQTQAALIVIMEALMSEVNRKIGIEKVADFVSLMEHGKKYENATGDINFNIDSALNVPDNVDTGTGSVLDWINTIVNTGLSIYNSVKSGSTSTGGINPGNVNDNDILLELLNKIKGNASDVGSDSINKSIDKYKWWIIGGFAFLLLTVIIVVYAGKRR